MRCDRLFLFIGSVSLVLAFISLAVGRGDLGNVFLALTYISAVIAIVAIESGKIKKG